MGLWYQKWEKPLDWFLNVRREARAEFLNEEESVMKILRHSQLKLLVLPVFSFVRLVELVVLVLTC